MLETGANLQKLKEKNSLLVLQAIRGYGPVSRISIARMLGLSNTTCADITRDLAAMGLIRETGRGDSSGGRKPALLEINWDYAYCLGMIVSQEGISCGVYNLKLEQREFVSHPVNLAGKDIVSIIEEVALRTISAGGLDPGDIAGMTIGVGGIVDAEKANIIGSTHFRSREIIHIHERLDSIFPFPLYLENYGNLIALAEKKLYYPGHESFVFIQIDAGIGGGIIINNKILRGAYGFAGEIGHMSIDKNGPLCFCGNRGCLEMMGSIPVLLQKASFGLLSHPNSRINEYIQGGRLSVEAIAKAFKDGDTLAEELFEEEVNVLYHTVMNIVLLYDPQVIVLGGEVALFGRALIDSIQQKLGETIFGGDGRTIAFSRLAEHPLICGACMYVIESFFEDPRFENCKNSTNLATA
jgi:predicted NBD/HSP70 family sugar kinase